MRGGGILNLEKLELDILLLGRSYKFKNIIQSATNAHIKRIICPFHKNNFFNTHVQSFLYLQMGKHLVHRLILQSVRCIDKKHFDKNIAKINFLNAKIPTLAHNKALIDEFFKNYAHKKRVALNACAFSNPDFRLEMKDFVALAENLAKSYPEILFVFMNFKGSGYEFAPFRQKNIAVFVNDDDLLNLVELTSRFDLLISIDTGNVHIADNVNVPVLELIKKRKISFHWCGGFYGNECELVKLPNHWKKDYEFYKNAFYCKAKKCIERLVLRQI